MSVNEATKQVIAAARTCHDFFEYDSHERGWADKEQRLFRNLKVALDKYDKARKATKK